MIRGHSMRKGSNKTILDFNLVDDIDQTINKFKTSITVVFETPITKFQHEIEPWDNLVEAGRIHLRDNWSLKIISTIAAGIKSKNELYDEYVALHDNSISLCKRARCARLKSGNINYWNNLFNNSPDIKFTLLVFFTWATPKTIIKLFLSLSKIVKKMKTNDFLLLTNGLSSTVMNSSFSKTQQKYIQDHISNIENHDKIKYILSLRFDESSGQSFVYNNIKSNTSFLSIVNAKLEYLIDAYLKDTSNSEVLEELKIKYESIDQRNEIYYHHRTENIKIPYEISKKIMLDCKNYPNIITTIAENSCRLIANENIKAIGEIAINEKWFDEN